ncbi:Mitochondrial carrier domain containing protein [Lactarius tabidus]
MQARDGLYCGLDPNVAGNASSCGLYFVLYNHSYNQLKQRATDDVRDQPLSASQYFLFSAEASNVTTIFTNPVWVVKVWTFTAPPNSPPAHCGRALEYFRAIFRDKGWHQLYHGTSLALFGERNGVLQFTRYEKMKGWAFERKRQHIENFGRNHSINNYNTAYTITSGVLELGALYAMCPYQVHPSVSIIHPSSSASSELSSRAVWPRHRPPDMYLHAHASVVSQPIESWIPPTVR